MAHFVIITQVQRLLPELAEKELNGISGVAKPQGYNVKKRKV
jgi:hypothetical protein